MGSEVFLGVGQAVVLPHWAEERPVLTSRLPFHGLAVEATVGAAAVITGFTPLRVHQRLSPA
jgi:hypothetical protein